MTDKAVPAKIRLNKDLEIEEPVGKLYLQQTIRNTFKLFW